MFALLEKNYNKLIFLEPNDESAANVNAAKMWREDRTQFERIADNLVRKTLNLPQRKIDFN